jgi:ABC-type nitrate/sulfonate/bicarbonate transport system substrate-binding protein
MAFHDARRLRIARRLAVPLACLILALALPWPGGRSAAAEPSGRANTLRIGLALQPTNALVMIGLKLGYFTKEGLNAQVTKYASGVKALHEGLFAGEADLVTASDVPIAILGFQRNDFKIIATVYSVGNQNRIIARRDRGIVMPADLKGKRVATQKSSAVHFFLSLYLIDHGIAEKDVRLSYLAATDLPQALANGDIDAFAMREPYISQARKLIGDNAVVFDAPGLYDQTDQVVVSNALVEQQPESVTRVLRALLRAEEFARADPAHAKAIVAEYLGISTAEVAADWPRRSPKVDLRQALLSRLEGQARWAIRNGLAPGKTVPNYLDLLYLPALAAVKPEALTVIR